LAFLDPGVLGVVSLFLFVWFFLLPSPYTFLEGFGDRISSANMLFCCSPIPSSKRDTRQRTRSATDFTIWFVYPPVPFDGPPVLPTIATVDVV